MSRTKSGFSQPVIGEGPAPTRVGPLATRELLEVRFGGTAEQGVILMGLVFATAATRDHRYVAQTQNHALEESDAQGHSDVIISDNPVDFPELLGIDLLVSLDQSSADAYVPMLRPDGVFIYDSNEVGDPPCFEGMTYGIPLGEVARQAVVTGELAPALLTSGLVAAISGVVSSESLEKTLEEMALSGSMAQKKRALNCGLAMDTDEWRRDAECL